MRLCTHLAIWLAAGAAAGAQPVALNSNWNGLVHDGEQTLGFADDPDGYRSISDRALGMGTSDSLGGAGFSESTPNAVYDFVSTAGDLDIVMVGTREANGQLGWDLDVDGDFIGIAPTWDPSFGSGLVVESTTMFDAIAADENFAVSFIYTGSVGGGNFDVILGFADGDDVTVTVNAPDWFANFDPVPPPPAPGVASQEKLDGPLSEGDGFLGRNNVDWALPGEPLAVFEAVINAASLTEVEFDVVGRELTSVTFDATTTIIDSPSAGVAIFGLAANGDNIPLSFNWNGLVHEGEGTQSNADAPNGYRSIGDRGFFVGNADSIGGEGFSLDTEGFTYEFESGVDVVDMVMIGTRTAAFDDEANGDNIGTVPLWDPSKGGGLVLESVTEVDNLAVGGDFAMGVLYHATNGGGNFDMRLGFADDDTVTITLNSPDWFANGNPVPPPPGPGVASVTTLPGPLSGGDGFEGTGSTDQATADAPLSAFEAIVTAQSISDLGFDVSGRELTSITFDALNLIFENPNAAVGIFAASTGTDGGDDCIGDCDDNGSLDILDFVCFQLEWQNQTAKGDCDGNGSYDILDFVCFQLAWQDGCP